MNAQDLVINYCGQTFSDHTEAIDWLTRAAKQLEQDARQSAFKEAAEVKPDEYDKGGTSAYYDAGYEHGVSDKNQAILALAEKEKI